MLPAALPQTRILKLLACCAVIAMSALPLPAWADQTNSGAGQQSGIGKNNCSSLLQHDFKVLDKAEYQNLCQRYQGKLILVVNTASRCGYTPQYKGLEKIWNAYKDQGLVVLGFPSNNFAGQEPGDDSQIKNFCEVAYGVSFPMFSKTEVTGINVSSFYRQLSQAAGEPPGWNFHKYLISPDGEVLASFRSHVEPEDPQILNMISRHLPKMDTDNS